LTESNGYLTLYFDVNDIAMSNVKILELSLKIVGTQNLKLKRVKGYYEKFSPLEALEMVKNAIMKRIV
jgi:hypothetical protein